MKTGSMTRAIASHRFSNRTGPPTCCSLACTLARRWPFPVTSGRKPADFNVSRVASLIICSRSPRLLAKCLKAVAECTSYPNREVIVVQHLGNEDAALEAVIKRYTARSLTYSGPFHFSRMNNMAGQIATGEVLVFI